MRQDKKRKDKSAAALVLCFCLMAMVSVFAVQASINKVRNNMSGAQVTDVIKEKAADAETDARDKSSEAVIDSLDSSRPDSSSASKYIFPVTGDIIMEHSTDMPVYWETLDQYMTHPGVDISAAPSTEVSAIADGTVSKVYNDDRYGVTVHISHGDGLTSIYSNLAEQGLTETGNEVKQGDIIGSVGDTALFESLDETHLHFAMTKDSNPVDPGEYIDTLKQ